MNVTTNRPKRPSRDELRQRWDAVAESFQQLERQTRITQKDLDWQVTR